LGVPRQSRGFTQGNYSRCRPSVRQAFARRIPGSPAIPSSVVSGAECAGSESKTEVRIVFFRQVGRTVERSSHGVHDRPAVLVCCGSRQADSMSRSAHGAPGKGLFAAVSQPRAETVSISGRPLSASAAKETGSPLFFKELSTANPKNNITQYRPGWSVRHVGVGRGRVCEGGRRRRRDGIAWRRTASLPRESARHMKAGMGVDVKVQRVSMLLQDSYE
jgi:hypothetical protein